MRTHSRGAFKLDIPPSSEPVSSFAMALDDDDLDEDVEEEEADSTAHPTSNCAASCTTAGDHGEESRSELDSELAVDVEEAESVEDPEPPPQTQISMNVQLELLISPRTAAKRRAQSIEAAERLRARGRRRIDDDD